MALIEIHDAEPSVRYVSGEPEVEYGLNGNVLVHWPTGDDFGLVTLAFRSDEHFQLAVETMDRAYLHAREARSREQWPGLWAGSPE